MNSTEHSTGSETQKLEQVFRQFDADDSGYISFAELQQSFASLGVVLSDAQAKRLICGIDVNHDNQISFEEFERAFNSLSQVNLHTVAQQWMSLVGVDFGNELSLSTPPTQRTPEWRMVVAGGFGGMTSRTCTAPLERLKILAQTSDHPFRGGLAPYSSVLRNIVREEGLQGLFRGNGAACLRVFPFAATTCLAYGNIVRLLPADDELDWFEPLWRATAGGVAAAFATCLTYPLDLIKARLSSQTVPPSQPALTMRSILKEEGVRGLYRGMSATLATMVPFVALQQSFYDVSKMIAFEGLQAEPSTPLFLTCGALAGTLAQTVVYPLDVMRRRSQVKRTGRMTQGSPRILSGFTWLAHSLRDFVRVNGARGLFSGILPTYMKVAPSVAISVYIRDLSLGRLR